MSDMSPGTTFEDVVNAPMPTAGPGDVIGGFAAPRDTRYPDHLVGGAPNVYHAGDEFDILRGLTTENRVRLQQQMVALGLASDVVYGEIDGGEGGKSGTLGAMRELLAMANRQGEPWEATLGRIATEGEQHAANAFEPEPYLAPDYATLSQRVKSTFREALGRDPDDYEIQQLASELSGFDALAHEREQELTGMATEQRAQPGRQGGGSVQGVDPLARFQELFEERYSGELDFVEDKEAAVGQRDAVQAGSNLLAGASRRSF